MRSSAARQYRFHGVDLAIDCQVPLLATDLRRLLMPFSLHDHNWPLALRGQQSTGEQLPGAPHRRLLRGIIRPYQALEVRRLMPSNCTRLDVANDRLVNGGELYADGDRFWLMDDRWGAACIDLLRGCWQSWVLPAPALCPLQCLEMAVTWPLAQTLLRRGILLMPAISVMRGEWGALLVGTMNLAAELSTLLHAGFQIVGQGWTALRDQDGTLQTLGVPGQMQEFQRLSPGKSAWRWVDFTSRHFGTQADRGTCDAVLLIRTGRRPHARLEELSPAIRGEALRRCWPITELHPQPRRARWPMRVGRDSRVFEVDLSRKSDDLLGLIHSIRWPAIHSDALGRNVIASIPVSTRRVEHSSLMAVHRSA